MEYIKRYFTPPNDSYFIFGPRGTGKSTWIKQSLPQAYIINLLDDFTYRQHLADPSYIKSIVAAHQETKQFVIDEIQKVPAMLDSVHELIEEHRDYQFILTGSSARKLKRQGVNLLGGRALLTHFHPYMASEIAEQFDLMSALQYGLVPLIVNSKNPKEKLSAYIALYLKEEVQMEGLVRNIGDFARFLETMSFSHGSTLNLNNIARECNVSRKIVENYISILEDLLIGYKLFVFTKRAKRETIHHPKFYFFDAGVYYHLRPKGPLDNTDEMAGMALEGLVLQHLKAWCDYSSNTDAKCYFWRTVGGSEVDFIVYGENCFKAIEVKNAKQVFSKDLRSLKEFHKDYPEAELILLYRGKEKRLIDNILCLPVETFLLELIPNKPI